MVRWDDAIASHPAGRPHLAYQEGPPEERIATAVDWAALYGTERRGLRRYVTWGWFLLAGILVALGVMFAIGLTLHEAYDAQTAMGAHVNPPPFNGLFETIHGWLASSSPCKYLWKHC